MPDSAQGTNKHLRIGGQSKIMMYNRESDDATLPDLSPQGIATSKALPTGAWTCFEYHLGTDGGVYFGWESYGGDVNTFWYDDIVVSSTRVGC
jgi:hypothetical protein